jgi:mono/diheme cytochrome c family protein
MESTVDTPIARHGWALVRTALAAGVVVAWASVALADDSFSAVRAILEAKCLRCHQGDEPKGGLSLESGDLALAGGDSGPAFEVGNPEESVLLELISGDAPQMPAQADPLTPAEVAAVKAWIAAGAKWPEGVRLTPREMKVETWWSLAPLGSHSPPQVDSPWVRTPIDAFVLDRLNQAGMNPSPEADRRTLIRRLTYNLHGLPPTPAEVAEFLADASPGAYERLVDRLLASPRYGERWGRHWLDVVHFGESHGYDKDKPRPHAWPYRDYVIRALNADKPYGRFIAEQLAGDVLEPKNPDGVVATGFIAAGPWDFVGHVELREGTKDKEITRSNDRDDMVTTTASTFLSLTVHCARCHDHKFDPIPQQDYYRMQAVFAGVDRADRNYDADPAVHAQRSELTEKRRALEAERAALVEERSRIADSTTEDLKAVIARLEADLVASDADTDKSPSNGYHSAIEATPDVAKWLEIDLGRDVALEQVRLVPARPTDFPDTPGFGFPRQYQVAVQADGGPWRTVVDRTNEDQPNPGDQPVDVSLDGASVRVVRVTATRLWERTADYVFALGELQALSGDNRVAPVAEARSLDSIEEGRWAKQFAFDGFDSRKRLPTAVPVAKRDALVEELRTRKQELEQRIDAAVGEPASAKLAELGGRLEELQRRWQTLPTPQQVYAASSGFKPEANFTAPQQPRPIHLLLRGSVETPGPLVGPGALQCVSGVDVEFPAIDSADEAARRAALARWITDPQNPLTWRSIVNRTWHYHFDRGLVDSPNDFGRMGSRPSHPELLDWLSHWFLENGQSLKALHRLIVTSAVYRQSSAENADYAKLDGENQLLWRMNRRRLEAECVRDAALYVSGSLDLAMGGPSVQQFAFKDDHSPVYDYERFNVDSPDSRRRSVYRFLVRSVPDPLMERLDCPDPSFSTPKRNTTLTAIQALATLNNKFFVRQAERLAEFAAGQAEGIREQTAIAFEAALSRPPEPAELDTLTAHAQHHGLPNTCRVILNCNEFMFVD